MSSKNLKAQIKMAEGLTLMGRGASKHWVPLDTSPAAGGAGSGTSPFEMVFLAMGGCQSMDILSILKKKRNKVEKYDLRINAKRRDEHPKIAEIVEMEFCFWGEVKPKDVERAIELSTDKYCGVSAMLRDDIIVKRTYKINEEIEDFE
ncbi:MAG: OsmC family protein [Candidatus Zixiibacteriota bacterium]